MKKNKAKTRIAKGVFLISFIVLFARLIFSLIQSWDFYKKTTLTSIPIILQIMTNIYVNLFL
ncbi:hypothetical protein BVAF_521 [Candidatus Blochmanniella vafra str. BVAF]|uniref:Uncharacterized protein n=1 Tax=Blochmanniella vafra (strain BVAF) TaxID=859654 RepID=E8Q6D4_BLOVB|nr:hypothetical protein BVAF_521 [Candidatus Blochmannia vafer str. BVAF]